MGDMHAEVACKSACVVAVCYGALFAWDKNRSEDSQQNETHCLHEVLAKHTKRLWLRIAGLHVGGVSLI